MTDKEIREGDIVEIDYIAEFTKEHINEGKALVIWKGFNHQPLVRKLNTKNTIWTSYEHISKVVEHIDIEGYMDKALEQEPKTGHWNDIPKYKDIAWQCSECEHFTTMKHNYCPNCGCRMVEPQESEDV